MPSPHTLPALAVIAAAAALAGCGSSSSSSSASASTPAPAATAPSTPTGGVAPAASGSTVTVQNFAFSPKDLHVKVGTTVKWVNNDQAPHNIVVLSGPHFASSPTLNPGGSSYSAKLTKPGQIGYYCSIHPFMKAIIVVGG